MLVSILRPVVRAITRPVNNDIPEPPAPSMLFIEEGKLVSTGQLTNTAKLWS